MFLILAGCPSRFRPTVFRSAGSPFLLDAFPVAISRSTPRPTSDTPDFVLAINKNANAARANRTAWRGDWERESRETRLKPARLTYGGLAAKMPARRARTEGVSAMSEKQEKYLAAGEDVRRAIRDVEELMPRVSAGAHALENWKSMHVSNATDLVFSHKAMLTAGNPSFDAMAWPNGRQIVEAVSRYHVAIMELEDLWQKMPQDDQSEVPQPSHYELPTT